MGVSCISTTTDEKKIAIDGLSGDQSLNNSVNERQRLRG